MARSVASWDVFVLSFRVVSAVVGCLISIFMVVPLLFTDRQFLPSSIFVSDFEKDFVLQLGWDGGSQRYSRLSVRFRRRGGAGSR